jgi:hypothetical protein
MEHDCLLWGDSEDNFKFLMVVPMKNAVFRDVALCGFITNQRFGGMY